MENINMNQEDSLQSDQVTQDENIKSSSEENISLMDNQLENIPEKIDEINEESDAENTAQVSEVDNATIPNVVTESKPVESEDTEDIDCPVCSKDGEGKSHVVLFNGEDVYIDDAHAIPIDGLRNSNRQDYEMRVKNYSTLKKQIASKDTSSIDSNVITSILIKSIQNDFKEAKNYHSSFIDPPEEENALITNHLEETMLTPQSFDVTTDGFVSFDLWLQECQSISQKMDLTFQREPYNSQNKPAITSVDPIDETSLWSSLLSNVRNIAKMSKTLEHTTSYGTPRDTYSSYQSLSHISGTPTSTRSVDLTHLHTNSNNNTTN
ncbi:hypothetical protein WA158_002072 [Blastocystis sp. Blastoise]